ncbi:unnamed protein product [Pedinophyceae sp. YPF-701]|nr:unnamed protein product [Pedinophyceae sp. YPF-701]
MWARWKAQWRRLDAMVRKSGVVISPRGRMGATIVRVATGSCGMATWFRIVDIYRGVCADPGAPTTGLASLPLFKASAWTDNFDCNFKVFIIHFVPVNAISQFVWAAIFFAPLLGVNNSVTRSMWDNRSRIAQRQFVPRIFALALMNLCHEWPALSICSMGTAFNVCSALEYEAGRDTAQETDADRRMRRTAAISMYAAWLIAMAVELVIGRLTPARFAGYLWSAVVCRLFYWGVCFTFGSEARVLARGGETGDVSAMGVDVEVVSYISLAADWALTAHVPLLAALAAAWRHSAVHGPLLWRAWERWALAGALTGLVAFAGMPKVAGARAEVRTASWVLLTSALGVACTWGPLGAGLHAAVTAMEVAHLSAEPVGKELRFERGTLTALRGLAAASCAAALLTGAGLWPALTALGVYLAMVEVYPRVASTQPRRDALRTVARQLYGGAVHSSPVVILLCAWTTVVVLLPVLMFLSFGKGDGTVTFATLIGLAMVLLAAGGLQNAGALAAAVHEELIGTIMPAKVARELVSQTLQREVDDAEQATRRPLAAVQSEARTGRLRTGRAASIFARSVNDSSRGISDHSAASSLHTEASMASRSTHGFARTSNLAPRADSATLRPQRSDLDDVADRSSASLGVLQQPLAAARETSIRGAGGSAQAAGVMSRAAHGPSSDALEKSDPSASAHRVEESDLSRRSALARIEELAHQMEEEGMPGRDNVDGMSEVFEMLDVLRAGGVEVDAERGKDLVASVENMVDAARTGGAIPLAGDDQRVTLQTQRSLTSRAEAETGHTSPATSTRGAELIRQEARSKRQAQLQLAHQSIVRHCGNVCEQAIQQWHAPGAPMRNPLCFTTFHDVICVFSDIVSFTPLNQQIGDGAMLDLLHSYFTMLDSAASLMGLYKYETVGDAYVAIVNMEHRTASSANRNRAEEDVMLALTFAELMHHAANSIEIPRKAEGPRTGPAPSMDEQQRLQVRVGIHRGALSGAVLGDIRTLFSLFGETMTEAERMESTGRPGWIKMTYDVYRHLPHPIQSLCEGVVDHRHRDGPRTLGDIDAAWGSMNEDDTPPEKMAYMLEVIRERRVPRIGGASKQGSSIEHVVDGDPRSAPRRWSTFNAHHEVGGGHPGDRRASVGGSGAEEKEDEEVGMVRRTGGVTQGRWRG